MKKLLFATGKLLIFSLYSGETKNCPALRERMKPRGSPLEGFRLVTLEEEHLSQVASSGPAPASPGPWVSAFGEGPGSRPPLRAWVSAFGEGPGPCPPPYPTPRPGSPPLGRGVSVQGLTTGLVGAAALRAPHLHQGRAHAALHVGAAEALTHCAGGGRGRVRHRHLGAGVLRNTLAKEGLPPGSP